MKDILKLTLTTFVLLSSSAWAEPWKRYTNKEEHFSVLAQKPIKFQLNKEQQLRGYFYSLNERGDKENGHAVVVSAGPQKLTIQKFLEKYRKEDKSLSKAAVQQIQVANYPAVEFDTVSSDGLPMYMRIIAAPDRTFAVFGNSRNVTSNIEFVKSFRVESDPAPGKKASVSKKKP